MDGDRLVSRDHCNRTSSQREAASRIIRRSEAVVVVGEEHGTVKWCYR